MAKRKRFKLRRNYYHSRWKKVPTVRDFDFLFIFIWLWVWAFILYNKDKTIEILSIVWKVMVGLFLLFILYKVWKLLSKSLKVNISKEKSHTFYVTKKAPIQIEENISENQEKKIIIPKSDNGWSLLQQLENLWWREFEFFIAEAFKKKWYKAKIWPCRADEWIDVWAWKKDETILIQCKKWKSNGIYIWVKEVREFFWVISSYKWSKWLYVTTTWLTQSAKEFIEKNNINIWSKNNLEERIKEIFEPWDIIAIDLKESDKKMSQQRFCIECWCEMAIKTAKRWENPWTQFYGCTGYPECRRTEEI